jgi:hypothetical protein
MGSQMLLFLFSPSELLHEVRFATAFLKAEMRKVKKSKKIEKD